MSTASVAGQVTGLDNRFTREFGVPAERVKHKVRSSLSEDLRAFISRSPFLVMATADARGLPDASPKGGRPGFVAVLDDRHLLIPDVAGNKLFQSYLNLDENPGVGLIFFVPGEDRTVRVNGRARILSGAELAERGVAMALYNVDENARLLQGLLVEVQEAYGHCPRALKFADLWNEETIRVNRKAP